MHSGCSLSLQVSFAWPVSTMLPRSCVHGAVTLGCLYPATPCGMNDSVRTQCLGVAVAERAQSKLSLTSRPFRFRSIFVSLWRSSFDLSISVN